MPPKLAPFLRAGIKAARAQPPPATSLLCPICQDTQAILIPVLTPCGHYFCKECLLDNAEHRNTCPTCRMELFAADYENRDEAAGAPEHEDQISPEALEENGWLEEIAREGRMGRRRRVRGVRVEIGPEEYRSLWEEAVVGGGRNERVFEEGRIWPDLTPRMGREGAAGGFDTAGVLRWMDENRIGPGLGHPEEWEDVSGRSLGPDLYERGLMAARRHRTVCRPMEARRMLYQDGGRSRLRDGEARMTAGSPRRSTNRSTDYRRDHPRHGFFQGLARRALHRLTSHL